MAVSAVRADQAEAAVGRAKARARAAMMAASVARAEALALRLVAQPTVAIALAVRLVRPGRQAGRRKVARASPVARTAAAWAVRLAAVLRANRRALRSARMAWLVDPVRLQAAVASPARAASPARVAAAQVVLHAVFRAPLGRPAVASLARAASLARVAAAQVVLHAAFWAPLGRLAVHPRAKERARASVGISASKSKRNINKYLLSCLPAWLRCTPTYTFPQSGLLLRKSRLRPDWIAPCSPTPACFCS